MTKRAAGVFDDHTAGRLHRLPKSETGDDCLSGEI